MYLGRVNGGRPRKPGWRFGTRKAAGGYAGRFTDLAFTRQKDQHVAIRPAAPEIVDRRGDCAFLIAVIGQRAVALFDRIGAPGDEKYRRVVEVLRQLFRIERCRRDAHLERGTLRQEERKSAG